MRGAYCGDRGEFTLASVGRALTRPRFMSPQNWGLGGLMYSNDELIWYHNDRLTPRSAIECKTPCSCSQNVSSTMSY